MNKKWTEHLITFYAIEWESVQRARVEWEVSIYRGWVENEFINEITDLTESIKCYAIMFDTRIHSLRKILSASIKLYGFRWKMLCDKIAFHHMHVTKTKAERNFNSVLYFLNVLTCRFRWPEDVWKGILLCIILLHHQIFADVRYHHVHPGKESEINSEKFDEADIIDSFPFPSTKLTRLQPDEIYLKTIDFFIKKNFNSSNT